MNIISLGPFCITKALINNLKYHSPTLPFDWMFSSLPFIKKVLLNNFNDLVNKDLIKSSNPCWDKNKSYNLQYNSDILQSKNVTTHFLIKNELPDYYNFHMWNHYNLLEDEQYNKYMKYVDRFKTIFESDELKFFIYIQYYDDTIREIIDFNDYLMETITNYKLFCIKCIKTNKKRKDHFYCSYEKDNLHIYDLEIEKYEDNINTEDLDKIKIAINNLISPKNI
jgi:hypothetical protein